MIPVPRFTGNLQAWASQLTMYLRTYAEQTFPVRLRHLATGDDAKAVEPGVLMYNPDVGLPVYSKGGEWKTLSGDYADLSGLPSLDFVPLAGGTLTSAPAQATSLLTLAEGAGATGWFLEAVDDAGISVFNINQVGSINIGTKVGAVDTFGHNLGVQGNAEHERDGVGQVSFNQSTAGWGIARLTAFDPARPVLQVQGAALQATNLQEWKDSTGATLVAVLANGNLRLASSSPPATSSAAGLAGEVAWDSSYMYVCVSTNSWKRAPLQSW